MNPGRPRTFDIGGANGTIDVLYLDSQVSERATFVLREMKAVSARLRVHAYSVRAMPHGEEAQVRSLPFPVSHLNPLSPSVLRACLHRFRLDPASCWPAAMTILRRDGRGFRRLGKAVYAILLGVALAEWVRKGRIQIGRIHAHWGTAPSTVAWLLSRLTGVPYSVTVHASDLYLGTRMLDLKLRAAAAVVTCTSYNAALIQRRTTDGGAIAAHVVRHGLPLGEYSFAPCVNPEAPFRILAVGRYVASKGFSVLLDALDHLRHQIPFVCEIYGENGPEKRPLALRARALGFRSRVSLNDWVAPDALRAVFSRSHVLVVPSVVDAAGGMDGLPNVIIEALALGLPVVATRISGIPEAVLDGTTGILVPPGDARALAEAIRRILTDHDLRAAVSRNGRRLVEDVYDARRTTDELMDILLAPGAACQDRRIPACS